MPDVFTKAWRSQVMSLIRGRGNKDTELALIRVFRAQRITGWRRHVELRGPKQRGEGRPRLAARARRVLQREGWQVLRIWEHELARLRRTGL